MGQSWNWQGIKTVASCLHRPSLLVPHRVVPDIRAIDFAQLKAAGVRAIGFDKDNCLTAPYQTKLHGPFEDAWARCRAAFDDGHIVIVSNSAGTEADDPGYRQAADIERHLGVPVLRHPLKKPGGGEALSQRFPNLQPAQVAFVGDRLMTDVLFGNLNGWLTIWTRQIVSAEGDNPTAARLRRWEYRIHDALVRNGVKPPNHPAA
ncbi:hypothetical protein IWQ60_005896 [Tieghemiomyces parasiticus]|uniref:Uncharacterized protein n=1 Tax=Tieghemiomyces parasiticus TaxID=78921 RepID=A0A9W8DU77_9FUNG|nr:hypothetical protein IWQ60_005896 [Tieghemiomyces parasiticus]